MSSRKIIAIGEAVHSVLEAVVKGGKPLKKKLTAAQEEALRLRVETAQRERQDYATKTAKRQPFDASGEGDGAEEGQPASLVGAPGPTDVEMMKLLCPSIDDQLQHPGSSLTGQSIMEEITEDWMNGKLTPFTPGPIGEVSKAKRGPAPMLMSKAQIMEERRAEMLALRARNDRTMAQILESR